MDTRSSATVDPVAELAGQTVERASNNLADRSKRLESELRQILADHGTAITSDARLLRGMLNDNLGEAGRRHHLQVNLLLTALEAGICSEFVKLGRADLPVLRRMAEVLEQEQGISTENARWVVEAWARVLCGSNISGQALEAEIIPLPTLMREVATSELRRPKRPITGETMKRLAAAAFVVSTLLAPTFRSTTSQDPEFDLEAGTSELPSSEDDALDFTDSNSEGGASGTAAPQQPQNDDYPTADPQSSKQPETTLTRPTVKQNSGPAAPKPVVPTTAPESFQPPPGFPFDNNGAPLIDAPQADQVPTTRVNR